ncbi:hypothetical protein GWK41_02085 [Persephonella atlantica]|uniref:DUF485 domain-containing protein n=1 Tax=Persephonella atlantica TaxID=2699429 RepID=A0ABS1GG12_9AQUI|nr:hypothetical protein [Persephonella atlantica]MBK3331855.1 hypothetical protein [Persephonella atlantica]
MAEITKPVETEIEEENVETKRKSISEYYSYEDFLLNRKVTILYGITFFFIFLSAVVSEILSLVFHEGLLSPVQVVFHSVAFVGYVITFYYVYRKQDYIEKKNTEIFKKQEEIDREELKKFI